MAATDFVTESQISALVTELYTSDNAISDAAVDSTVVDDVVEVSQAAYDALSTPRPAGRLYLITS